MDDLIYRSAALKSLGEPPPIWQASDYEVGMQVQWSCDFNAIKSVLPAQPEIKEIDYSQCADAMLKMWIDKVVTDGEYYRIMDKLNVYWAKRRGDEVDS